MRGIRAKKIRRLAENVIFMENEDKDVALGKLYTRYQVIEHKKQKGLPPSIQIKLDKSCLRAAYQEIKKYTKWT